MVRATVKDLRSTIATLFPVGIATISHLPSLVAAVPYAATLILFALATRLTRTALWLLAALLTSARAPGQEASDEAVIGLARLGHALFREFAERVRRPVCW